MGASQYKDYVLVLLFVKYVSDKYAGDPNALIDVPAGGSFADMVAAKGDKEIGDRMNKIIGRLPARSREPWHHYIGEGLVIQHEGKPIQFVVALGAAARVSRACRLLGRG